MGSLESPARAVAERIFAARARGDVEEVLDSFTEDALIRVQGASHVPFVGDFETPEARRFFFSEALGTSTNVSRTVRGLLADGDDVVILGTFDFAVDATGRHYEGDWALHLHVVDGKVSLWQMYENSWSVGLAYDVPEPAASPGPVR